VIAKAAWRSLASIDPKPRIRRAPLHKRTAFASRSSARRATSVRFAIRGNQTALVQKTPIGL
jgi:hypothetical protein